MATSYDFRDHSWVVVKHPQSQKSPELYWEDEAWRGPHQIVLHVGTHVWIANSYAGEGHPEVKRVGDGRSNGYDEQGCCVLSVPAAWCTYYNHQEAESIERCMAIDNDLLAYAR